MITVNEIAPKVYAISNGKGRRWAVHLNAPSPRIENESGAAIEPTGSLGVKMLRLIALQFPASPYIQ